jgi:hypothetical protein
LRCFAAHRGKCFHRQIFPLGRAIAGKAAARILSACRRRQVAGLGFSEEEADKLLARAFGWGTQAFWRNERVDVVPSPAELQEAIGFVRELGAAGTSDPNPSANP